MIYQINSYYDTPNYGAKQHNNELLRHNKVNQINVKYSTNKLFKLRTFLKTARVISNKHNVVHFTNNHMSWISNMCKCKSLLTIHDMIGYQFYNSDQEYIKHYDKFNHLITVSNYSKSQIAKECEINCDDISVIYNGVNKLKYYKVDTPRDNSFKLMYVGNTMPHKNLNFILGVCKQLQKCTDKIVMFTRYGYDESHGLQQYVKGWLKYLAHEMEVTYYDFGYKRDLNPYYNAADVYVAPSYVEGFDIPIIEAMACNLPVVASNNSSHPEVVENAGKLCDFDIDEWVEAILYMNENRLKYESAMNEQSSKFNWKTSANKLDNLYKIFGE